MRILVGLAAVCALHAQTIAPGSRFEEASIRLAPEGQERFNANPSYRAYREGKASSFCDVCISGVHYDNYGTPLIVLIANAYRVDPRLVAGPAWLHDENTQFVIHATMPEGATRAQVPEMLRAMLEQRFHVAAHLEDGEQPGYALVVAKNGPKLKPARELDRSECPEWTESIPVDGKTSLLCRIPGEGGGSGTTLMTNSRFGPMRNTTRRTEDGFETHEEYFRIAMPVLVEALGERLSTGNPLGVPGTIVQVADRSGIEGEWYVEVDSASRDLALPAVNGSLERQGLRLEKMMTPVKRLVLDRVERTPTEN
ncbi:MAG TPA: TIGR03435 family protein [Bryobacteraceae bacterium]|jgi:uncharacterized protein (TIGR03435 family)